MICKVYIKYTFSRAQKTKLNQKWRPPVTMRTRLVTTRSWSVGAALNFPARLMVSRVLTRDR